MLGLNTLEARPPMPDTQYRAWRELVRTRCGLDFPPSRQRVLLRALQARMRATGQPSLVDYWTKVDGESGILHEWPALVQLLVNHESRFFRHRPSFAAIEKLILPALQTQQTNQPTIRCWSVGCAAGQEPFSLAMSLDLHLAETHAWHVLATDISRSILNRAHRALFKPETMANCSPTLLQRYTQPAETPVDRRRQIVDDLRQRVAFRYHNICDENCLTPINMDLIICQNLLIYLDQSTRQRAVERLVAALRPGGFLILGPAEIVGWRPASVQAVAYPDTLIFQRTA